MTTRRFVALLGCVWTVATLGPHAQPRSPAPRPASPGPATAPATRPAYESVTTAILVDVVVRDRQGRPVTNLDASDFEISEDGRQQQVGSFTRVARGGGIGVNIGIRDPGNTTVVGPPSPATDEAPAEVDRTPVVTALVFDALSSEALGMCKRAALGYLPMNGSSAARVAVFSVDPSIKVLQGYTDNPALVRQAVGHVMATGSSVRQQNAEPLEHLRGQRDTLDRLTATATAAQSVGGGQGLSSGAGTNIGQLEMERRLVQGQIRMLQAFDTLDRDQRGFGTTNALFSVLQSLVDMPGRKTVVYFSEGLPSSPALQAHLQSVVEAANKANITVYAIDASGLRAVSGTLDTRKEVEEAGKERIRQLSAPDTYTEEPMMRVIERTEDLLRFDSQGGLARLAEGTGGFLVRDTNDLRQAFKRIDEDTRFHYLLTYVPTNQAFDGKFRSIGVRVKRPSVDVFARKGYRALRSAPSLPVLDYEAPAVAALEATRLPAAFPFTTTVLNFPEAGRTGLSPLVVRIATDVLAYEQDGGKGVYNGQATVVVRFRNATGDIVDKVSQQYQLSGRLHELEAAKRGEILFYREPELSPGVYTVEAVVHDGVANRASARVSTLEVPTPVEGRARLSSIVLVRRTERVPAASQQIGNPLYVGDLLFYPNAGEPLSRARDRELTFYYTLYPRRAGDGLPRTDVELRRNGRTLVQIPAELVAPDARGRVQQVSRLPLESLADGTYELRIVVHDGRQVVERSTFFKVAG
jgi:VWFA-related protein